MGSNCPAEISFREDNNKMNHMLNTINYGALIREHRNKYYVRMSDNARFDDDLTYYLPRNIISILTGRGEIEWATKTCENEEKQAIKDGKIIIDDWERVESDWLNEWNKTIDKYVSDYVAHIKSRVSSQNYLNQDGNDCLLRNLVVTSTYNISNNDQRVSYE